MILKDGKKTKKKNYKILTVFTMNEESRIRTVKVVQTYTIVLDNELEWNIIPVEKREEWETFCSSDGYEFKENPNWAKRIGKDLTKLMIRDYIIK